MNILLINTMDDKGGAAQLVYTLKKGFEKSGHAASMFVKHKSLPDEHIFEVARPNPVLREMSRLSKGLTGIDPVRYVQNKVRAAFSNDISFFNDRGLMNSRELKEADIIHCHNLHGNYFNLKNLEKISEIKPVIWSLHDMWSMTPHDAWIVKDGAGIEKFKMEVTPKLKWNNRQFLLRAKRNIYANSDLHIVGTSEWFMRELKKSILKEKKTYLIHDGIDEAIFKPCDKKSAREELGLPADKTIITFMANGGKGNEQKGWQYAREAIRHYSGNENILFLCIGGKEKDDLLDGKNIRYVEYVQNELSCSLYLSASDIFLHPSMAEAFGLTLVQAMACGTPVVTFPVGVAEEAIEHKKTGYIADYQDATDLIRGIEYILHLNKQDMETMGRLSRQKVVEDYTLDIMVKNHIQLYENVLQLRAQKPAQSAQRI